MNSLVGGQVKILRTFLEGDFTLRVVGHITLSSGFRFQIEPLPAPAPNRLSSSLLLHFNASFERGPELVSLVNTQKLILISVGVVVGFIIGFTFANSVNRSEQDKLRAEVMRLRGASREGGGVGAPSAETSRGTAASSASDPSQQTLTDEEIRRKIADGDANPKDIKYQRELGRGLYLYAMNTSRADLLPAIVRMLERVHEAEPKDDSTTILLANAHFLAGQNGDPQSFEEARRYYQKVLEQKPEDTYARTALGLTYFFDRPPDAPRAIKEYRRSLRIDPRHEMTVQSLASALIATGELAEAERRIDELQSLNPSNPALPNLRAELAQKKNAASEQSASKTRDRD